METEACLFPEGVPEAQAQGHRRSGPQLDRQRVRLQVRQMDHQLYHCCRKPGLC